MSEREEKRGGAGCAIVLVMVVLFLPVLYVLSIGPVAWLMGNEATWWSEAFYYPLDQLAAHSKPFRDALGCYLDFWT